MRPATRVKRSPTASAAPPASSPARPRSWCVFGGMATGELVMFQQMGFGLAVAVLIDATIVRTIIVPAAMELLGERNWYFPRWLQWIPSISVEGHSYEPAAPKESRRPRREPGITVPRPSLEGAEN